MSAISTFRDFAICKKIKLSFENETFLQETLISFLINNARPFPLSFSSNQKITSKNNHKKLW